MQLILNYLSRDIHVLIFYKLDEQTSIKALAANDHVVELGACRLIIKRKSYREGKRFSVGYKQSPRQVIATSVPLKGNKLFLSSKIAIKGKYQNKA